MAYNNQNVFLRTSPSTTLLGVGKREGVLRASEIGKNGASTFSPRGSEARMACAMVMKA
jgi:hypothetical protein